MNWHIPSEERKYLRELSKKQAEYASLPVMEKRKRLWYDLNDAVPGALPPVIAETWTFDGDFLPARIFRCTTEPAKSIEYQLLRNIRNYELLNDDKVMPDFFEINWFMEINEFGIPVEREVRRNKEGYELGFQYVHPIKNLKEDFHLLDRAVCKVDKKKTFAWKAFLEDLFGDMLPVVIRTNNIECTSLTNRVIQLMGMESFYTHMLTDPDEVHRLMTYLTDNAIYIYQWMETEGLLLVNNGNQDSFGSSYNFTTRLPSSGYTGGPARLCDFWGNTNAEETVGISPELFKEFCLPYYIRVCEPFGLIYYGCCEAVDPIWESVKRIPHLKKVSVSAWCDQQIMGEALRDSEIVFSRKADPRFVGVDIKLNEESWKAYIRETLKETHNVFTEFIFRDVYTLHGNLGKMRRAIDLTRLEIARHFDLK
jgi:hypothetical protein